MADELGTPALRPDAPLRERLLVDAVDDPCPGDQRVLLARDRAADEPDRRLRLVVLGDHQRACVLGAELAPPRLCDPVGVGVAQGGLLRGALGKRLAERPCPVGEPAEDGVRERDRPFQARPADELDRLVDGGVARDAVEERQLVRAEAQRGAHGWVELSHRSPAERLDRVVERPNPLDGAVGDPPGERPVPLVERGRLRGEGPVGVRAVLEDAPQHGEGRAPGR